MLKRLIFSQRENPISSNAPSLDDSLFLPNFCHRRAVLRSLAVAELTAMLVVMAQGSQPGLPVWLNFILVSLYLLWIALVSITALCWSRPFLARFSAIWAGMLSWALLLAVTTLIAEIAYQVGHGLLGPPWFSANDHGLFLIRNLCISALISAVALRYLWLRHEHVLQVKAESQARLQALEARIRPHFLFNSLNSVAALIATHPDKAEDVVLDLSDLFRASLNDRRQWLPLADELHICEAYIRVETARLGDRLRIQWQISDEARRALVPVLSVQPLLENAIYHGIEQLPDGGTLLVDAAVKSGELQILIRNPRPTGDSSHSGSGQALPNITARLKLKHGEAASLVASAQPQSFSVEIRMPAATA